MEQANTGAIERKALIFNVQKYNMYDGPGVRTNVFFKGCPPALQVVRQPGRSGAEDAGDV